MSISFQILCNGPGTCVPVCICGFLLKVNYFKEYLQIIFKTVNYSLENPIGQVFVIK